MEKQFSICIWHTAHAIQEKYCNECIHTLEDAQGATKENSYIIGSGFCFLNNTKT